MVTRSRVPQPKKWQCIAPCYWLDKHWSIGEVYEGFDKPPIGKVPDQKVRNVKSGEKRPFFELVK